MRAVLIFVAFLLFSFGIMAKENKEMYAVSAIPDSLLINANIVIRNEHLTVNIVSLSNVKVTESYAITILNEKGDAQANLVMRDDNTMSTSSIKGRIYDRDGKFVAKLKKKDIEEFGSRYSFISDDRYKSFRFKYSVYPYTVEYETESILHHTFKLPEWSVVSGRNCSVVSAGIEIIHPIDIPVRYRTFNIPNAPKVSTESGTTNISTFISRLPATGAAEEMEDEGMYPKPNLIMAVDDFELHGHVGNMSTWKGFGQFFYKLNEGRDNLSPEKKRYVHNLTDSCQTPRKKVELLYTYLQKSTRYLSIQLGIGGWQTAEATKVSDIGYGDCKALTNYMKALLKEAGISGFQALVYAGNDKGKSLFPDFPYNQFNHVILYVPLSQDTIWLECTNDKLPPGYLSAFTRGRNALLLQPDGGHLVMTPRNSTHTNCLQRNVVLTVSSKETKCTITERRQGVWWEQEHALCYKNKSEKEDFLAGKYNIPSYSVLNYHLSNNLSNPPEILESLTISASGLFKKSGNRAILKHGILRNYTQTPSGASDRQTPFRIKESYIILDTIIIKTPSQYTIVQQPTSRKASFPFGSYEYTTNVINDTTLKVTRKITRKTGVFSAASFHDYIKLCSMENSEDNNIELTEME